MPMETMNQLQIVDLIFKKFLGHIMNSLNNKLLTKEINQKLIN